MTVAIQEYDTYVNQAHVIRGNDVIVKCDIPSFVTDFVTVISWQDNAENAFQANAISNQGNDANHTRLRIIIKVNGVNCDVRKTFPLMMVNFIYCKQEKTHLFVLTQFPILVLLTSNLMLLKLVTFSGTYPQNYYPPSKGFFK